MSLEAKLRGLRQILRFDNRLHLLLQRLFFRGDRLAVYRMGPLEFVVDHAAGDASGAPDVLTRPMYLDYLSHLQAAHPVTVLDIGANAGGFPMFLVKHGISLARVVAVELNPRTCVRLRFNLERNVSADIEVVNAGLCGRARTLALALGDGSVADSLYAPSFNASAATTIVAGRTFDDLCVSAFGDQPVDICKIDVEQAEYEVVDHPGHDRLRQCRIVVMEIHDVPGRHHGHVTEAIERLGFRRLPQQSDRSVYVFVNEAADAPRIRTA
jgi:FkbM family methyltransferase